jgi:dTMP kinase
MVRAPAERRTGTGERVTAPRPGRFVVLEGGDGSGKSTQVATLAARLRERGDDVVATFEPGATPAGAAIRAILLGGEARVDALAETLLMAADRAQHVGEVIRPALARGAWVVSDRHLPSSLAYQGVVRGVGVDVVERVNRLATDGVEPDVVVLLDVDDATAAVRRAGGDRPARGDRMEREAADFHAAVRAAYRALAAERGWVVVDASGDRDDVAARVWSAVVAATDAAS